MSVYSPLALAGLAATCDPRNSRELEALIFCHQRGIEFVLIATGHEAYGEICDPADHGYGWTNKTTTGYLYARTPEEDYLKGDQRGNRVQGYGSDWPRYLTSVDEARKLCPKGWFIRVTEGRFGVWQCELWHGDKSVHLPRDVAGTGATEAQARTVAALNAIAFMKVKEAE